jgi:flagellar basal body-associated protein FliL
MAAEAQASEEKKPAGSSFKQLLVIGFIIILGQLALVKFVLLPYLRPPPPAGETATSEAKEKSKEKKRRQHKAGEKPAETGEVEIKGLVININPAGGGTKTYLMVDMTMAYNLTEEEKEYYKKLGEDKAGGGGGGEEGGGEEGGGQKIFEKAMLPAIKHRIIEFFSSKTEAELTAGGAIRKLSKELRRTLNRMLNDESEEEEPVAMLSPPALPPEGGEVPQEGSSTTGGVAEEEEDPHPITEIYFTNFVMQ